MRRSNPLASCNTSGAGSTIRLLGLTCVTTHICIRKHSLLGGWVTKRQSNLCVWMQGSLSHYFQNKRITWLELSLGRIGLRQLCGRCQAVLGPHGYRNRVLHVALQYGKHFPVARQASSEVHLNSGQFAAIMIVVEIPHSKGRDTRNHQDNLALHFLGSTGVAGPDGMPRCPNSRTTNLVVL